VAPIGQVRVPAAPAPAPAAASSGGETVADESKVCRSPFAGTVSRVEVEPGRKIAPNETLIVLEAMKMETIITAPVAGTIAKVNVGVGDAVQQGKVLIEFE
jgi:methylmalonyl-CoA carboxyltransferase small subunit